MSKSGFTVRTTLTCLLSLFFIASIAIFDETAAKEKLCPKITTKRDCVKFEKCKWAPAKNKCVGKKAGNKKGTQKKKCNSFGTATGCKAQNHCSWKHTANICKKK